VRAPPRALEPGAQDLVRRDRGRLDVLRLEEVALRLAHLEVVECWFSSAPARLYCSCASTRACVEPPRRLRVGDVAQRAAHLLDDLHALLVQIM